MTNTELNGKKKKKQNSFPRGFVSFPLPISSSIISAAQKHPNTHHRVAGGPDAGELDGHRVGAPFELRQLLDHRSPVKHVSPTFNMRKQNKTKQNNTKQNKRNKKYANRFRAMCCREREQQTSHLWVATSQRDCRWCLAVLHSSTTCHLQKLELLLCTWEGSPEAGGRELRRGFLRHVQRPRLALVRPRNPLPRLLCAVGLEHVPLPTDKTKAGRDESDNGT